MSLARAITKSIKRSESSKEPSPSLPSRTQNAKMRITIDRSKISMPVALVSTTNMLSYNAPDIATLKKDPSLTPTSKSSPTADDSDHSSSGRSRASSHSSRHTAYTDASSVADSPTSPAPNHLSIFFATAPNGNHASTPPPNTKQVRKSLSTTSLRRVKEEPVESVPALPQRALSHSKRAHERLAHTRSMQNVSTHTSIPSRASIGSVQTVSTHKSVPSRGSMSSLRKPREQRVSLDLFRNPIEEEGHPFGRELEQLNEVAEELSGVIRDAETEADMTVMRSRNLATFCAADYAAEIRPLMGRRFGLSQQAPAMAWI